MLISGLYWVLLRSEAVMCVGDINNFYESIYFIECDLFYAVFQRYGIDFIMYVSYLWKGSIWSWIVFVFF